MVSICIEFLGIVEYLFLGYLINDIVKFTSIFTVFCCFNWIYMNLFFLWIDVWFHLLERFFIFIFSPVILVSLMFPYQVLIFNFQNLIFNLSDKLTQNCFYVLRYYIKTKIFFLILFVNYLNCDFLIEQHWIWKNISG